MVSARRAGLVGHAAHHLAQLLKQTERRLAVIGQTREALVQLDLANSALAEDAVQSIRLTWDDGCPVNLYFTAKDKNKSHVSVQHGKLARKTDVDRVKAFWGEHLGTLAEMLVKN